MNKLIQSIVLTFVLIGLAFSSVWASFENNLKYCQEQMKR